MLSQELRNKILKSLSELKHKLTILVFRILIILMKINFLIIKLK